MPADDHERGARAGGGPAEFIREPAPEGLFICRFCEEGNLLSQGRSYGANGVGVSLGFRRMGFMVMSGADMPNRSTLPCP